MIGLIASAIRSEGNDFMRKLPIAIAAATLAVAPVAGQAAPTARAAAPTAEENELGGTLLWIVVLLGVIVGAFLLLDDDNDPVSP